MTDETPESFRVAKVPPGQLELVWDQVLPNLERALKHGCGDSITTEQVFAELKSGDLILWVFHDGPEVIAAIILSVRKYPAKKSLIVEFAAGRGMAMWIETLEGLLRDFRDSVGATHIEASCRLGLAKKLKQRGWRTKATIMEMQ